MTRRMSRAQRREACMDVAKGMVDRLEAWYDAHPEASFGEIEQQVRQERRELMGQVLGILINGRDTGFRFQALCCDRCGAEMEFSDYRGWTVYGLEGDTRLERAYYLCPNCEGQTLFPLDRRLKLRHDHWSEGAARVATRHGLRAPSFRQAAEDYTDAVGGTISESSLRRITLGVSQEMEEWKDGEAERACAPVQGGEDHRSRRVVAKEPITGQANISTDGVKIRIREEGWKEVKISAISKVEVRPSDAKQKSATQRLESGFACLRPSRRGEDPQVRLSEHSYCAGLWDADESGRHQYTEGLRRCIDQVQRLSSVNDGAPWIERITFTNFPEAVQILDWGHASRRLWAVGHALYGESSEEARPWVEARLDDLWTGKGWAVVGTLKALKLDQRQVPDEVRQAPGYFESNLARMRYDQFRAQGYPIGSGTVESGCKNVVHLRMRRPGRGWKRDNAQAMLAGLTELHSGRFAWAWQHIHQLAGQSHPHF